MLNPLTVCKRTPPPAPHPLPSGALQDVVMPHALAVFGAEHSPEAAAASYVFSMYANVLLPVHPAPLT